MPTGTTTKHRGYLRSWAQRLNQTITPLDIIAFGGFSAILVRLIVFSGLMQCRLGQHLNSVPNLIHKLCFHAFFSLAAQSEDTTYDG